MATITELTVIVNDIIKKESISFFEQGINNFPNRRIKRETHKPEDHPWLDNLMVMSQLLEGKIKLPHGRYITESYIDGDKKETMEFKSGCEQCWKSYFKIKRYQERKAQQIVMESIKSESKLKNFQRDNHPSLSSSPIVNPSVGFFDEGGSFPAPDRPGIFVNPNDHPWLDNLMIYSQYLVGDQLLPHGYYTDKDYISNCQECKTMAERRFNYHESRPRNVNQRDSDTSSTPK